MNVLKERLSEAQRAALAATTADLGLVIDIAQWVELLEEKVDRLEKMVAALAAEATKSPPVPVTTHVPANGKAVYGYCPYCPAPLTRPKAKTCGRPICQKTNHKALNRALALKKKALNRKPVTVVAGEGVRS